MTAHAGKTNAVRLLENLGIEFELRAYEVIERTFKTLVVRGDRNGVSLAVVAGNAELDLKALAKATGDRKTTAAPSTASTRPSPRTQHPPVPHKVLLQAERTLNLTPILSWRTRRMLKKFAVFGFPRGPSIRCKLLFGVRTATDNCSNPMVEFMASLSTALPVSTSPPR